MTEPLATATARLADVLTAENAALAALDLPRAGAMLAAKTAAAEAFVAARASPGSIEAAPPLAELARLQALAAANQRLLETAIQVQARVIGVIARALPRALRDPAAARYGAQGHAEATRPSAFALSARA